MEVNIPTYTACRCENSEKWCVCINGTPAPELGLFDTEEKAVAKAREEYLRAKVQAIDPDATFQSPTSDSNMTYHGPIVTTVDLADKLGHGFAQMSGRRVYILHSFAAPEHHSNLSIVDVKYKDGRGIAAIVPDRPKGGIAD